MTAEQLVALGARAGIEVRAWGQRGRAAADLIEETLRVRLSNDLRAFAEEIGNADIGASQVVVSGSGRTPEFSAITETLGMRSARPQAPLDRILISWGGGRLYCAVSGSDEILLFKMASRTLAEPLERWATFGAFMEWLAEFEASTEEDDPDDY